MHIDGLTSRRELLKQGCGFGAGLVLGFGSEPSVTDAAYGPSWPALQAGDVFICVRGSSSSSVILGHFDHVAIWDGSNVIEAQYGNVGNGGGVLSTPLQTFHDRYRTLMVQRFNSSIKASAAARYARGLVGKPYQIPSNFSKIKDILTGYTCVLLLRCGFYFATGSDPGWILPDHVALAPGFRWIGAK